MNIDGRSPDRIDREITCDPIAVGAHSVQPVAKVTGRVWRGADAAATFGAGFVRVQPVEVIVRDGNGDEHILAVTDPTAEALRGMSMAAMAVACIAVLVGLAATILSRRCGRPVPTDDALEDGE